MRFYEVVTKNSPEHKIIHKSWINPNTKKIYRLDNTEHWRFVLSNLDKFNTDPKNYVEDVFNNAWVRATYEELNGKRVLYLEALYPSWARKALTYYLSLFPDIYVVNLDTEEGFYHLESKDVDSFAKRGILPRKRVFAAESMLMEAKEVYDLRHENIEHKFKYFGSEKTSDYISPEDGFHWVYSDGVLILASTNNELYSYIVATGLYKDKEPPHILLKKAPKAVTQSWNALSGKVDHTTKTVTIHKESVEDKKRQRLIPNVKEFKKALKELMRYGVTKDYKIKGVPSHIPKTVGEALTTVDPTEEIFGSNDVITLYHGTSAKRWEKIRKEGLKPGQTEDVYVDLVPDYSEHNIYLATNPKIAEFYAKRQAQKDGSNEWVILEVRVAQKNKLRSDDWYAWKTVKDQNGEFKHVIIGHDPTQIKIGLRNKGEVAYKGRILPQNIKPYKKGRV